jgi:hypothetical protein
VSRLEAAKFTVKCPISWSPRLVFRKRVASKCSRISTFRNKFEWNKICESF